MHQRLMSNELREHFPNLDFDAFFRDPQTNTETMNGRPSNDDATSRQMNCLKERLDLITTEKSINTDERCSYIMQKRFLPLNDREIEVELKKLSEEFHWNAIKNTSEPSLDVTLSVDRLVMRVSPNYQIDEDVISFP